MTFDCYQVVVLEIHATYMFFQHLESRPVVVLWYEIRGFGTYLYVPVCTGMYNCIYGTYLYEPVCAKFVQFITSNISVNWGIILVFNHDYMTVLYTEYLLPL
jgi:hypothetical protein